jgi:hypothetical protein
MLKVKVNMLSSETFLTREKGNGSSMSYSKKVECDIVN